MKPDVTAENTRNCSSIGFERNGDFLPTDQVSVGSKLKCPVFVASEMSGFKVVPAPIGLG